ncbi:MAG: 2Fe-2S iron-sulfur cluster-binding protein [Actinomycetes bacterium]
MAPEVALTVSLEVDGRLVETPAEGTLLDALRGRCGIIEVKDGCSPQGQCGCCTVLVDGVARVSCVTPIRRVAGRSITTPAHLEEQLLSRLIAAFEATGASQCGFCTPGILARLAGLSRRGVPTEAQVRTALGAHLCRCTGNQPIVEAALLALDPTAEIPEPRDSDKAAARATLESGTDQHAGVDVVLGRAGFSADVAPAGVRVAIATADGSYRIGATIEEARVAAASVQGRNSTAPLRLPLTVPDLDDVALSLRTTFVEPAYVEPDASWCDPGGTPSSPYANAGAFGAKRRSLIVDDARRLATEEGCPVLAVWPREEVVRRGAKRPPLALALRANRTGILRVAVTPGSDPLDDLRETVEAIAPGLVIEFVEIPGPRVGSTHRGAIVAEVLAALAVLGATGASGEALTVESPSGGRATVSIDDKGLNVSVAAGDPLCPITLRSYAIGAAHQGLSLVRSEGIAVDTSGVIHDLTIRSFGILTASQTPPIAVTLLDDDRPAVACGVAVMAATMAAAWIHAGTPPAWPTEREVTS